tara:strand:+ start:180 stop:476 length:297 start_codon:yes stop_codon:yes gene_type:complete
MHGICPVLSIARRDNVLFFLLEMEDDEDEEDEEVEDLLIEMSLVLLLLLLLANEVGTIRQINTSPNTLDTLVELDVANRSESVTILDLYIFLLLFKDM